MQNFKKQSIVLTLLILITNILNSATYGPEFIPQPNGDVRIVFYHGPKVQIEQNVYACPSPDKVVCTDILVGNDYTIGNVIAAGTRVHIWNNFLNGPYGVTNAIITTEWDPNSNIEPTFSTDLQSMEVNDYNTWKYTTFIK